MPRLTPTQIRGARGMLAWSMLDLAKAARLSVSTVKRMEAAGPRPVPDEAYDAVQTALEAARLRFTFDSGRGEGLWIDHG